MMMDQESSSPLNRHEQDDVDIGDDEDETDAASAAKPVTFDTFEQVLSAVGSFGAYHWAFIIVMQFSIVMWCGNFVFMPYATYMPTVKCHVNGSVVVHDHRNATFFCELYSGGHCSNVTWEAPFRTIIEQWGLLCDLDYVPELINTIQMVGTLVALFFTGVLSDKFGRKRVFTVCFVVLMVACYLGTLAPDWQTLAASRFVVGGLISATFVVNFVWSMEMTGQDNNFVMNLAGLWHFGYISTALIGYLTRDWQLYLLILDAIGLPLLFFYTCFVESPRWLIQKGRLEKAAKQLTRMSQRNQSACNRVLITSDSLSAIPQERDGKRHGLLTLLSSRRLLLYTFLLSLITFATASASYAFVFQVSLLSGSPFVKLAMYGAFRIYIPFVLYYADRKLDWFGRREMIYIPMLIVCLCYTMATMSEVLTGSSNLIAMMAGAVCCNCLWTGIGQYQMELFPTRLRSTSSSVVLMFDPLASVFMPQLVYAERYYHPAPVMEVALVTFIALVAAYTMLPETKGRPLPDTLDDVAELGYERAMRPWKRLRRLLCDTGNDTELLANMEADVEPIDGAM
uniref:Major facilitator superfamily (MFS) profile domain-containing protein n=1 Tax=Plectus sambesii TaxID=2011161 RepID=A0A914UHP3_9BILA